MRGNAKLWLVVMLLMVVFAVKGVMLAPPAVPHASAFDTGRAIGRLERVLGDQRPHPVDSDADDAVRGRLVAELRALGLNPQVRAREDCRAFGIMEKIFRTRFCLHGTGQVKDHIHSAHRPAQ